MRREVEARLAELYATALEGARIEMIEHDELASAELLPRSCPYTWKQMLERQWLPVNRHGLTDEPS
jgi:hypothetical protein